MERKFSSLLENCPEEYRRQMVKTTYRAGEDIIRQGGRVKARH